jgi:hypothetical protein
MDPIVKVTVWVPDQQALNEVLAAATVSLECGAPPRDTDGNFVVTLYGSPAAAAAIAALPYRCELDDTYPGSCSSRLRVSRDAISGVTGCGEGRSGLGVGPARRFRGDVGVGSAWFGAAVIAAGGRESLLGCDAATGGVQPAAAGSVLSFWNAALSASVHGQAAGRCSLPRRPENTSRAATCSRR